MKHNLKKSNKNQAELLVELLKDDLKMYLDRAEIELGRGFQVDGFRKGKVPNDMVRKNIDSKYILELALDLALKDSLAQVIDKEGLDVLNVSDLIVKENTADKLVYTVALILFPEVNIKDLANLKVAKREVKVEQKDIDETLETIKASRAVFSDKEGLAEKGDRVEVDFEVKQDGQILEGGISKNHPLIIGGKNFIPGFEEELVGMKIDGEKTFSLVAPEDYYMKVIAGKKLDFVVRVNSIKSVRLPEVDDSFAQSLGKFESKSHLLENIKEGITEEKRMKEKQRLRLEILGQIISKSDIGIPGQLVEQQLDTMIKNFDQDLHANEMEIGLYLARVGKTQDDLKREWRPEAEKQVKIAMIIHKVAKEQNIKVPQEEVEEVLDSTLQSITERGETDRANVDIEVLRSNITERITNEKVMDFLESTCSV